MSARSLYGWRLARGRRLVSQMFIENLPVAAAGACLAIPFALSAGRLGGIPRDAGQFHSPEPHCRWRPATFVAGAAALAALLFGLLPALRVSLIDPIVAMRRASRGLTLDRRRGGSSAHSWSHRSRSPWSHLLRVALRPDLPQPCQQSTRASSRTARWPSRSSIVLLRSFPAEEISGVSGAADAHDSFAARCGRRGVLHARPIERIDLVAFLSGDRRPAVKAGAKRRGSRMSAPGYFETLRIPRRAGRDFQPQDTARSRRVMLVNESFVRSHLDRRNPYSTTVHPSG